MNRALFLDRDGVINKKASEGSYITQWEAFEFLPGAIEAIRNLSHLGFMVVIVTNQQGIAKKLMTGSDLEAIHANMRGKLREAGTDVVAIYHCPHDSRANCACRKPKPGLLLAAQKELQIAMAQSWIIGDSASDIEAGKRAGCRTVLLGDQFTPSDVTGNSTPDVLATSLLDAVERIAQYDEEH